MNTIKELRADVGSFNKCLKPVLHRMSAIELLRNCHPLHRGVHAKKLYLEKVITKDQALEFVRI
jgi:hypothetical protein